MRPHARTRLLSADAGSQTGAPADRTPVSRGDTASNKLPLRLLARPRFLAAATAGVWTQKTLLAPLLLLCIPPPSSNSLLVSPPHPLGEPHSPGHHLHTSLLTQPAYSPPSMATDLKPTSSKEQDAFEERDERAAEEAVTLTPDERKRLERKLVRKIDARFSMCVLLALLCGSRRARASRRKAGVGRLRPTRMTPGS